MYLTWRWSGCHCRCGHWGFVHWWYAQPRAYHPSNAGSSTISGSRDDVSPEYTNMVAKYIQLERKYNQVFCRTIYSLTRHTTSPWKGMHPSIHMAIGKTSTLYRHEANLGIALDGDSTWEFMYICVDSLLSQRLHLSHPVLQWLTNISQCIYQNRTQMSKLKKQCVVNKF